MDERVMEAFGVQAGSALQAAQRLGFVDSEAQVLAQMFDAQQRRLPRGASPSGFALQADNLPVRRPFQGFAPLQRRDMDQRREQAPYTVRTASAHAPPCVADFGSGRPR